MYPSPVHFVRLEPGSRGAILRWVEPLVGAVSYVVFRATRPVRPSETEDFYAGLLSKHIRRMELPPETRALVDESPPPDAWYLVQARDRDGNLVSVDATIQPAGDGLVSVPDDAVTIGQSAPPPPGGRGAYARMPEIIYRDDDARGVVAIRTMARGMEARFRKPGEEELP